MKKYVMTANDDLKYPEYPMLNWKQGETYEASEIDGDILQVESETGPFFFYGVARQYLSQVFTMVEVGADNE